MVVESVTTEKLKNIPKH